MTNFDEEQKKLTSKVKEATDEAKRAAKQLKEAKKDVQTAREEKETISVEQQQLVKEKTKLDFLIKDLTDEVVGDNKSKVSVIRIRVLKNKFNDKGKSFADTSTIFRIQN